MLYIGTESPNKLRVYDPEVGVKDLVYKEEAHKFVDVMFNNPDIEAIWEPPHTVRRENVTITDRTLLNPRTEAEYQLNEKEEQRLVNLGPIQRNPYDCGPLCVYAALVARRST